MRLERHSPEAQEKIESTEVSEGVPKWASPSAVDKEVVDICRLSACCGELFASLLQCCLTSLAVDYFAQLFVMAFAPQFAANNPPNGNSISKSSEKGYDMQLKEVNNYSEYRC